VATEDKLLVSCEEAAQLLSINQRALDYLVASKRLPAKRIGGASPDSDGRTYGSMLAATIPNGSWVEVQIIMCS